MMSIVLKPFKELVAMSKEKLEEAMIPIRVRTIKAQADLKLTTLDADILMKEQEIHTLSAEKEINFDKLIDAMDAHALKVRRREQYGAVLSQLFPKE